MSGIRREEINGIPLEKALVSFIALRLEEKKLMGYPGYVDNNQTSTTFVYAYDNKAVSIVASNEDIIKQVLIVEDA